MNIRLPLVSSASLGLLALACAACASRPSDDAAPTVSSSPPVAEAPKSNASVVEQRTQKVSISRQAHGAAMSEVVLTAAADAALTLDVSGEVRLWPTLNAQAVSTPLALPVFEPAWMSVAQREGGHFVAAFVDTAGGAQVARVVTAGDAPSFEPLFELPAVDPQFEVYALPEGRVLTLGQDHRIRLFSDDGTLLSAIDRPGFVPWQLRVSNEPGQPLSVVAVLAGPTRVQPIKIEGNAMSLSGEAREIGLDRGPNRNDLILAPDGRSVAALRKPRSRGDVFTVELIELATNERRLVAGDIGNRKLPRLHWVDADRMLLEDGEGRGMWLDLDQAQTWTEPTDREFTEDIVPTPLMAVGLSRSSFETRPHTAVQAGVRVVPTSDTLVVDPLDEESHLVISQERMQPLAVALDDAGHRAAWGLVRRIVVDDVEDHSAIKSYNIEVNDAIELAFVGDEKLLHLGRAGELYLRTIDDGGIVSQVDLETDGTVASAGFRRTASGGTLGVVDQRSARTMQVLDVDLSGWKSPTVGPSDQRSRWPELGTRDSDTAHIMEAIGYDARRSREITALVADSQGRHLITGNGEHPVLHQLANGTVTELPLRGGLVRRVVPDPEGNRIAVVQRVSTGATFNEFAVSMYDLTAQRREWTHGVVGFSDLDWSGDGSRLAIASDDGGFVVDAATGDTHSVRRHLGLSAELHDDPTVAVAP